MLPDSPLEYDLQPGATRENTVPKTGKTWQYQINSDGFRGEDFATRNSGKRILFVGDSYTFGWAVDQEQVLPESVERELAKLPYELEVDACNLGVSGYNTFQEYHLLNQVIDRYSPDLVVLGFVMNDAEPQQTVTTQPSSHYKFVSSWLFAYIKVQINHYVYEGEPVLNTGIIDPLIEYDAAMKANGPDWLESRQAFSQLVVLCHSRDIPLIVVIYPDYTRPFDKRYPFSAIHAEVVGWADEHDVRAVDMLQYMRNKDHKEYRVEGDGHPNERAFAETARVIAPMIYEYLGRSAL
jgi:hypothetical protein